MFPRLLRSPRLTRIILITMTMMAQIVYSKLQDPSFTDLQAFEEFLIGEEALLALPLTHQHLNRDKRSPCHHAGGGTGTNGGTAGGGDGTDDSRRAGKRKAAAKKKALAGKITNSRKKKLMSDGDNKKNN